MNNTPEIVLEQTGTTREGVPHFDIPGKPLEEEPASQAIPSFWQAVALIGTFAIGVLATRMGA